MNVLVVGKAKTGTTVISKAIHQALAHARYHLEPKDAAYFDGQRSWDGSNIVKIIFEHWGQRPAERDALIGDRLAIRFDRKVLIVRDPRDEAISRLLYLAYPWLARTGAGTEASATLREWIELLRHKERNPSSVRGQDLFAWARDRMGTDVIAASARSTARYAAFLQTAPSDAFIVRYEDFVDGRIAALNEYLGLQLDPGAVTLGELSRTRRTASSGNWKSFFVQSEVAALQALFASVCSAQGYDDWALSPVDALDSRHFSGYVERLVRAGTPSRWQKIKGALRRVISGMPRPRR